MAKTLSDLRDETRMFLDESSATDWSDAQVDIEINNGYQEVITTVMETYEDFYLTSTTFDTDAEQEYTSGDGVPSNLFKLRRVEINYNTDASSSRNRAAFARLDEVYRDLANTSSIASFTKPAYYIYGFGSSFTIGFIPIPTRSDTNAVKLWYIPYQSDLSSASDAVSIPYPDRYWKAISWYAAGVLLSKGQQEETVGTKYLGKFEAEMIKMKQQLEDRAADGSKHVIETSGDDVDFTNYGLF